MSVTMITVAHESSAKGRCTNPLHASPASEETKMIGFGQPSTNCYRSTLSRASGLARLPSDGRTGR